jgi:hypothetical protein
MKRFITLILLMFGIKCTYGQTVFHDEKHKRLDSVFQLTCVKIFVDESAKYFYASNIRKEITISPNLILDFMKKYNVAIDTFLIQGILSHEYGHLKQQEKHMDLQSDSNFMFKELHADLMAGYYLSNYFRYELMANKTEDKDIASKICLFFKSRDRNPNLYLLVSMLINDSYDYTYNTQLFGGNDIETVKILRFTAFWQGIRFSELSSIDNVYSNGIEYIQRLISDKQQDKTFITFHVIGLEIINKVLQGKYNYNQTIDNVLNRVLNSSELPFDKKLEDSGALLLLRNSCQ